MLTQGRFLISYQVFDNIPVNNNGQTHVREILKDTQAFTFSYRTEQIRDYLRYQGCTQILYHCQILWMGTKRGRPRGNHFPYILFQYPRR
jgi:hypothetical protein